MTEFVDELPAKEPGTRKGKFDDFANELRDNPDRWARLERETVSKATQLASRINGGQVAGLSREEFQAAPRGNSTYVKFVPEGIERKPKKKGTSRNAAE